MSDTHPLNGDTDGDGRLDGDEDYDRDGLKNLDEQTHGTDPRLADTDDDGVGDLAEKVSGTAGNSSLSPLQFRVLRLGGGAGDYVDLPKDERFELSSWTLEAWVNPALGWGGNGMVLRRTVEAGETNYFLSVDGSMRPQAGFGQHRVLGAAAIPADGATWTHLAATYDKISQELTLYVNATQVASVVCSENPRYSGAGPLVQRIGEGFQGEVNEVRLWELKRSAASLAERMSTVLAGTEEGLVAYYRFDDGTSWRSSAPLVGTSANNVTNGATGVNPAIAQWQWGQVEDFALNHVQKDWTNRWRYCATIQGNVVFSNAPGAVVPLPAVRVLLMPPAAVGAGAQWSLNGGAWQNSGDVVTLPDTNNLTVTIAYRSLDGWTTPPIEMLTISNGITTTLTRYYQRNGSLTVYLEPAAIAGQTMFKVDGGTFLAGGTTVSNLSPGVHDVEYAEVDGWARPESEEILIGEGEHVVIVRSYLINQGSLRVFIEPPAARAAGAQWTLDGSNYYDSGYAATLYTGTYTVAFNRVPEWDEPPVTNVTIRPMAETNFTVTYTFAPGKDSDGDGLPDWWEILYGLDPFDIRGDNGANGDPDGDELNNYYEYLSGNDPHDVDTDNNGTWDGDEDADSDNLSNLDEQIVGTHPMNSDTDDDGFTDGDEYNAYVRCPTVGGRRLTSPLDSRSPVVQRSIDLNGTPIVIQDPVSGTTQRFNLATWSLECWIRPTGVQTGALIERVNSNGRTNFALRLNGNVPAVEFQTAAGTRYQATVPYSVPAGEWTHLAGVFDPSNRALTLYVNGISRQSQVTLEQCALGSATTRLGRGVVGQLDEVRIWPTARTTEQIVTWMPRILSNLPIEGKPDTRGVAVVVSGGDPVHERLNELGIPYSSISATDLFNAETYSAFRAIFLPCLIDTGPAANTNVQQNLRDFVAGGGRLYVACYSGDYVSKVWPDVATLTQGPSYQTTARIVDPEVAAYVGSDTINIPIGFDCIVSVNTGLVKEILYSDTVGLIAFSFESGAGKVIYTDFHSESGAEMNQEQMKFLQWVAGEVGAGAGSVREAGHPVAYFPFDDGGVLGEDFMHRLDWDYALVGLTFRADVYADLLGELDHDANGIPDWWEDLFFDGVCAADADTDGDGLNNLHEYWCDTNPLNPDTDGDGTWDGDEDYEGDGEGQNTTAGAGRVAGHRDLRQQVVGCETDTSDASMSMSSEKNRPSELTDELSRLLGARRSARLRRIMRQTGLPPEALLDLAIEMLDIASKRLAPPPIQRTAVGLGAARWRNVSPEERSEVLRRAAQARWAKKAEEGEKSSGE